MENKLIHQYIEDPEALSVESLQQLRQMVENPSVAAQLKGQLEIDQLSYDERILAASHESVMTALVGQIRSAADRRRAGLEVEPQQKSEISKLRRRLAANEQSAASLDERRETIRKRFEADLERYRILMEDFEG